MGKKLHYLLMSDHLLFQKALKGFSDSEIQMLLDFLERIYDNMI